MNSADLSYALYQLFSQTSLNVGDTAETQRPNNPTLTFTDAKGQECHDVMHHEWIPFTLVTSVKHQSGKLAYMNDRCFCQALINREILDKVYNVKTHVVVGSLGLGKKKAFFEYGHQHSILDVESTDFHVWLEDARGNVYDVVTSSMTFACLVHRQTINLAEKSIIFGKTKKALKKLGFEYVPAPQSQQDQMMDKLNGLEEDMQLATAYLSQL